MKTNENYLMIYSMTDDTNFAPHVKGGWISLACCASPVRENAKIGDIILGVGTKELEEKVGVPNHTIIFLMKVTEEPMKFNEYFNNDKFIGRVDNFYKKKDGRYTKDRRYVEDRRYIHFHEDEDDTKKSEYVLVSNYFYYFGDYWKKDKNLSEKGEEFCEEIGFRYTPGGHYKKLPLDDTRVRKLIRFINANYKPGKIGGPNELPTGSIDSHCQ